MSPRTNAPVTVPADAGSGLSDATDARSAAAPGTDSDTEPDADSGSGDSETASDLRTATRLLRLVKLVLGIVVSLLTALKLLGLL
jgi:hypothetical protein